MLLRNVINLIS